MYYYTFNIGDYVTSTHHLDEMEDLAYRRMIDLYYSKESPLPKSKSDIAKRIRMQTHSECIANVLQEFFTLGPDGYHHERIDKDLEAYKSKSSKAKRAANARWNKNNDLQNANASPKQSECNADAMPTNNHKPTTNNQDKEKRKVKTLLPDSFVINGAMKEWFDKQGFVINIEQTTDNWKDSMRAKGFKYVDWAAAWRNGMKKANGWALEKVPAANQPQQQLISGNPYEN